MEIKIFPFLTRAGRRRVTFLAVFPTMAIFILCQLLFAYFSNILTDFLPKTEASKSWKHWNSFVGRRIVRSMPLHSVLASSLPPYYQTFLSNDLHIFLCRVSSENVCYFTNQHFSKKFLSTSARGKIN